MVTRGVQQLLTLPPAPDSARAARRFVADVLRTAHADEFVDTAALLATELVTNGIVHAHTDLQVVVEATPAWVRVEVIDGNPRMPVRRDYDAEAITGRGLEMVELLADEFGVELLEQEGKRVWFRLGAVPGEHTEPAHSPGPGEAGPALTVQLVALPVTLYAAWQQHADAMLREATLAAFDEPGNADHDDYGMAGGALAALADSAAEIFDLREADVGAADITLSISPEAVRWFPILRELLEQATAMAADGRLLAPPSLPELVALRNWICDEVSRQAAGLPPTPWVSYDATERTPLELAAGTLAGVRDAAVAVVAADATNRIVAVSASAGELLGWDPTDLEGRRLVAIIPERLRDRHVAGFSRHLLDGSTTMVGRTLRLPALRRDGTEIAVEMTLERQSDPATRALFVATLTEV